MAKPRAYATQFPYENYPDADFLTHPEKPLDDRPFMLIREGLLLNEDAYRTLRDHAAPMGRGALVLLWIVLTAAVAQGIGLALGLLTSPRLDIIQSTIYESITSLGWFVNQAAASPEFAQQFNQAYATAWQGIRIAGGYPSWSSTLTTVASVVIGTYVNWLVYGFLAHWTARWFGGTASFAQFMGPLALSYAPLILTVVLIVPGASVAAPFLFLALLACKYVAVKTAHGLKPASSLAVVTIPYLLLLLLMAAIVIFGAAYGLDRIPFFEPIIRTLQLVRMF